MNKNEYLEILASEPNEIKLDNKDIVEWLDNIVDALKNAADSSFSLYWGRLNTKEGEYENRIQPCSSFGDSFMSLHIFDGIDKLAKVVGYDLKRKNWASAGSEYKYYYYFTYKNIEIFQLEEGKLEGDDK